MRASPTSPPCQCSLVLSTMRAQKMASASRSKRCISSTQWRGARPRPLVKNSTRVLPPAAGRAQAVCGVG